MIRFLLTLLGVAAIQTMLPLPVSAPAIASKTQEITPLVRVPPVFPADAPLELNEGWVIVEFSVTEEGRVQNVRVVDFSHAVFKGPAITATRRWKYRPKLENGVAVRVDGVRAKIVFERPPASDPATIPMELWQKKTKLALYSGHTVYVLPPQIVTRTRKGAGSPSETTRRPHHTFLFTAYVAFDFSSVSKSELRSIAREILERHLLSTATEMKAGEPIGAALKFVIATPGKPKPDQVLIESQSVILFFRNADDEWLARRLY